MPEAPSDARKIAGGSRMSPRGSLGHRRSSGRYPLGIVFPAVFKEAFCFVLVPPGGVPREGPDCRRPSFGPDPGGNFNFNFNFEP